MSPMEPTAPYPETPFPTPTPRVISVNGDLICHPVGAGACVLRRTPGATQEVCGCKTYSVVWLSA